MTSSFRSIVLALAVVALGAVPNAHAQIDNAIDFTTSFPFTAGNAIMPAGSYTITPVANEPQVLELKGARASVLFLTDSAQPRQLPAKSEVVFSRYGNDYVLKNIWVEGSDIGYVSAAALSESRLAKQGRPSSEHRVGARKNSDRVTKR